MRGVTVLLTWTCLWMSGLAQGHISSSGFLTAKVHDQEVEASLELAVRDIERAIGVDANADGKITWGELLNSEPNLTRYVGQHLGLSAGGAPCPLAFKTLEVNERVD